MHGIFDVTVWEFILQHVLKLFFSLSLVKYSCFHTHYCDEIDDFARAPPSIFESTVLVVSFIS